MTGAVSDFCLEGLSPDEMSRLLVVLETLEVEEGAELVREGEPTRDMYFIAAGEVQPVRSHVALQPLGPGKGFGSLGLLTGRPRAATVIARARSTILRLSYQAWLAFAQAEPAVALKVAQILLLPIREDLVLMTDSVAALLRGRSVPRALDVDVNVMGESRKVATGTPLSALLPREIDGHLVVGALLGQKPVTLTTPIVSRTTVAPLTLAHWEGRQIYARTAGLLLLEASHALDRGLDLRLGPSRGTVQVIEVHGQGPFPLPQLAEAVSAKMRELAGQALAIRREHWTVDEATEHFEEKGWDDAARLLQSSREATVSLVSCGSVYALSLGPTLPDTSQLTGFSLTPHGKDLLLDLGERDPRRNGAGPLLADIDRGMVADHRHWLDAMGVVSVGHFNTLCISGQVSQLIRVSEGFHEKQIGRIADSIAAARDRLRIIAIAGPSSSGKTTFIKRLTVQLQINGLNPIGLSLDDYYVDRELTVRDHTGEHDFEALEALDLDLLNAQVGRLLSGSEVKLARYDFRAGKSLPEGGRTLRLKSGDVLLMEGIHGLNPRLLAGIPTEGQLFRIFVHPETTLPFDRLSRVSPTDIRLLRRIVRDRYQRGYLAAENIMRWSSVLAGERKHIFPNQGNADAWFDTALVYEPSVLKVYAERYLLEVPSDHPAFATAYRLRHLVDRFVAIYPEHVPPTSLLREFIGGSGFEV